MTETATEHLPSWGWFCSYLKNLEKKITKKHFTKTVQLILSFLSFLSPGKKNKQQQKTTPPVEKWSDLSCNPKKSIKIEKPLPPFDKGHYFTNPNNAVLQLESKSTKITIHLHCLFPSKMGNFNDPCLKPQQTYPLAHQWPPQVSVLRAVATAKAKSPRPLRHSAVLFKIWS